MDLYGQEPEARLLGAFLSRLDHRSVIDVGAERGSFVAEMLAAGSDGVYAIEPETDNVRVLRERFDDEPRVHIRPYAASAADGELELHRSVNPTGGGISYGHTVLERPDTNEIAWSGTTTVPARSLASLVEAGELPARVGILKIDTEGHDLAVLEGIGHLDADVIVVEHWQDLPLSLGPCPWTADELTALLRPRGYGQFAFIAHRGEFVILRWNDAEIDAGHMGNLIFVHDRVLERLLPEIVACASILAAGAVAVGEMYAAAAAERLQLIQRLEREYDPTRSSP